MKRPHELSPADEERLARYRAGAMPPAERAAFERDALADDALAEALYREASFDALGDAGAARGATIVPLPRAHGPGRRRGWHVGARLAIAASAAVVIGVALWRAPDERPGPAPGADPVRGAEAVVRLVEPRGDLPGTPSRFVWTRDALAESYRVEVLDAAGVPVASLVTADTTLASERLGAALPESGSWRVVPIGTDGLERTPTDAAAFRAAKR